MLVLYNFEKAFNEIKGLSVEGNLKEYREFLESIKPFLGPYIPADIGLHPTLWLIMNTDTHDWTNIWRYYHSDYDCTKEELEDSEYDEEFDFTELFEDFVGAI